jgi:hypothetical protein
MKTYYILIVFFSALVMSTTALSQNIQTSSVEWNCSLTSVSEPSSVVPENTKVVTSADQVIWYNADGTVRNTLSIVDAVGSWTDVFDDGSITFSINSNGNSGTIHFSRIHDIIQISIQVVEGPESPMYDLTVSTVNAL